MTGTLSKLQHKKIRIGLFIFLYSVVALFGNPTFTVLAPPMVSGFIYYSAFVVIIFGVAMPLLSKKIRIIWFLLFFLLIILPNLYFYFVLKSPNLYFLLISGLIGSKFYYNAFLAPSKLDK